MKDKEARIKIENLEREVARLREELRKGWGHVPVKWFVDEAVYLRLSDVVPVLIEACGLKVSWDHNRIPHTILYVDDGVPIDPKNPVVKKKKKKSKKRA